MKTQFLSAASVLFASVSAITINEINGQAYLSPYNGQTLANISGLVTAVGPQGFFLRDLQPVKRTRRSQGSSSIYVFGTAMARNVKAGNVIQITAKVDEYRSSPAYILLTELVQPKDLKVISSNVSVTTVRLGRRGLEPPTKQFSALDEGGIFGVPNNKTLLSAANARLKSDAYGLDFWESLSGELVEIDGPVALGGNNNFGDVWIRGSWDVTGLNKRGGLTMTKGNKDGADANPEAIIVGSPLDGTKNADAKMGDKLQGPLVGVITQAFGFYRILPLTGIKIASDAGPAPGPTEFASKGTCKGVSIGQFNVENLSPTSAHLQRVAETISTVLRTPDLLFLQEVQDDDGATDSGTVSANSTLTSLTSAIFSKSGVRYSFVDIPPVNNQDGGEPGGNIRVSYLYKPSVLSLAPAPAGGDSTTAVNVLSGPRLSVNPGRIDPTNTAWTSSRKPLVAAFTLAKSSKLLFAINVHFSSKGGSSSLHGDARPPVNGALAARTAQISLTTEFVASLLRADKNANIVVAGDYNEFTFVEPMAKFEKVGMKDLDEVVGIKEEERYSYAFDMNAQQLDHVYVSKSIAKGVKGFEHLHVNSWFPKTQVSDHDPAVFVVDAC